MSINLSCCLNKTEDPAGREDRGELGGGGGEGSEKRETEVGGGSLVF